MSSGLNATELGLIRDAMVMSKLSTNAEVVRFKRDGRDEAVVILNGVPYRYHTFCLLATAVLRHGLSHSISDTEVRDVKLEQEMFHRELGLEYDSESMRLSSFKYGMMVCSGHTPSDSVWDSVDYLPVMTTIYTKMMEQV